MRELLLIRHATTDLAGRLCGHLDPPLNALGREQVSALVELLRDRQIDCVYTSDLRRAVETAEPLARAWGSSIVQNSNLREISFGAWEGLRWADVQSTGTGGARVKSWPMACPPDGEAFQNFRIRVIQTLNKIAFDRTHRTSVVVTHLGAIRTALTELVGLASDSELLRRIEYCSVYQFAIKGASWKLAGSIDIGCAGARSCRPGVL